MKKFLYLAVLATASSAALLSAPANAQYTGPSAEPAYKSVKEILANPVDDKDVTLKGHVLKKVSNEKYTFSDGTGEIRVEIDNDILPTTPIDDKTKVEIRGELEKDFMESPEIDVDTVTIVK